MGQDVGRLGRMACPERLVLCMHEHGTRKIQADDPRAGSEDLARIQGQRTRAGPQIQNEGGLVRNPQGGDGLATPSRVQLEADDPVQQVVSPGNPVEDVPDQGVVRGSHGPVTERGTPH